MHMIAAEATIDWTQVLVVGIPILVAQLTTVVIAALNHRKASAAATTAAAASVKVGETADQIAEVHRQTKPSNGHTLAAIVEGMQQEVSEVRGNQAALAREMGAHLADHERRNRD